MLGRWIDKITLTLLGAAGMYLLFLNAGFGIPMSAGLAFAGMALARMLYHSRPWRSRVTPEQTHSALTAIATLPEDEARTALKRLTGRANIVPLLRYPDAHLSAGEVFAQWRDHMGSETLTLVATCPAEPEAVALVETLKDPTCEIIDSAALTKTIRATGLYIPKDAPRVSLRQRIRRARSRLHRPASFRSMLYGVSLLGMYLLTGRTLCLLCGLILVGVNGAGWIRRFA